MSWFKSLGELRTQDGDFAEDIATSMLEITENEEDVVTLMTTTTQLRTDVDANMAAIVDNLALINTNTTNIGNNSALITTNINDISALQTASASYTEYPKTLSGSGAIVMDRDDIPRGLYSVDLQTERADDTQVCTATISGLFAGKSNTVAGFCSGVFVGEQNEIQVNCSYNAILGGFANTILDDATGGSRFNVVGGSNNTMDGKTERSAAFGANQTVTGSDACGVYGGSVHSMTDCLASVIMGGVLHTVTGSDTCGVFGGTGNSLTDCDASVIMGGSGNQLMQCTQSVILGSDTVMDGSAVPMANAVSVGQGNLVTCDRGMAFGSDNVVNVLSGTDGTAIGRSNVVLGDGAYAFGRNGQANHARSMVLNVDDNAVLSSKSDEITLAGANGVRFGAGFRYQHMTATLAPDTIYDLSLRSNGMLFEDRVGYEILVHGAPLPGNGATNTERPYIRKLNYVSWRRPDGNFAEESEALIVPSNSSSTTTVVSIVNISNRPHLRFDTNGEQVSFVTSIEVKYFFDDEESELVMV